MKDALRWGPGLGVGLDIFGQAHGDGSEEYRAAGDSHLVVTRWSILPFLFGLIQ